MDHNNHPRFKPIDNPDHISVLLPTRGRVERLVQALTSLEEITEDKSQVDVWIYVDDDDDSTIAAIREGVFKKLGLKINFHVGPRTKTLVDTVNVLWSVSSNAGIYVPAGDDFLCITRGWDRIVRDTFNQYSDRLVLAYSVNTLTDQEDMVFPVLSAEWINLQGYVFTGFFPFWFEDYWLDEIGQMIQRKRRLDIFMQSHGGKGKTSRMKNVPFWYRFFTNTIDERMAIADILRRVIYPVDSAEYQESVSRARDLAITFWHKNKTYDDARCAGWERNLAAHPAVFTPEYIRSYLEVEMAAVNRLMTKLEQFMRAGDDYRVIETLDNLLYASMKNKDIQYLRATYLMRKGRHAEAEQAAKEELFLQPGDEKTRRLLKDIQDKLHSGRVDNEHSADKGHPQDVLLQPAAQFLQQGNYEAVYRLMTTLTFQYPHYLPAYLWLGFSLLNLGMYSEAEEVYQSALKLDENSYHGIVGLGKVYLMTERLAEAQSFLNKALMINSADRDVWVAMAAVEQKLNQPEDIG